VVQQLTSMGLKNAYHVEGGWLEWLDAGYPKEPKPGDWY